MTMEDNIKFSNRKQIRVKAINDTTIMMLLMPFTDAIPSDYEGAMGVPISFLDKYSPDQFVILSANDIRLNDQVPYKSHGLIKDKDGTIKGVPTYVRIVIKHRKG